MIKINVDTRIWEIPEEEKILGVESDDKVKTLQFELSRNEFYNGLNFTDCNCFINYKNEYNDTIPYGITDMELQEDGTVTFTWEVSRGATISKGNTVAILCVKKVREDGTITNEWNSRVGTFRVHKGIEPSDSIVEKPEIDIVSQLLVVAQQANTNAQTNIDQSEKLIEQSNSLLEKAEGLGYLEEEFDVLEARMDQFTSLEEGSTTGDAELADIRVGFNGTRYDNAGGAVRGQIGSLSEDIVNKSEGQIRGLLVKNSYVETDGTIHSYKGWSRTNYIDVSQYSVLSLYTPDTIRYGVWLKEDKTSVVFPLLVPKTTTSLFVPINAKYLMISALSDVAKNIKIGVKKTRRCSNPVGMRAINVEYIGTGYISTSSGNILDSGTFVYTDYIDIPENMYIESDGTNEDNAYNAFYDEDKVYISSFNTKENRIKVPDNAKYMRLSTSNSNEQRVYTREPVALKICSFNVGLWTDGKSSNARVDDANVKAESIKLRRFLGNENFDFLLCEEATHEFDKSYKINAYEYCFKNNLPHGWTTSDSTASGPVRQFLLTGKYELKNVTYHNYENASSRGYVTFTSEIMGREITFINCHLSSGYSADDEMRAKERAELIKVLKNCEYGVLMGDFNARSIDDFNDFSEFNNANHGYYGDFKTWPAAKESDSNWPNGCIDNIITTKNIKIINVFMGEIAMSDHKPLIAEIDLM